MPATGPMPGTTLSTPGGMPASAARSPSIKQVKGVCSDGFKTTLFPVASAGARLFDEIISGWLNELSIPTTPSGNLVVYEW